MLNMPLKNKLVINLLTMKVDAFIGLSILFKLLSFRF